MVNENGGNSYSKVILVNPKWNGENLIEKIFPTPAKEQLYVQLQSSHKEKCTIFITDFSGKILMTYSIVLEDGINNISINTSKLANGCYIIEAQTLSKMERRNIVVSK